MKRLVLPLSVGLLLLVSASLHEVQASTSAEESEGQSQASPLGDLAQGHQGYPVSTSDRPLTILQGALDAQVSLVFHRHGSGFSSTTDEVFLLGASYGVLDDLEVRAGLPVSFGIFGSGGINLEVGATYRLLSTEDLQLGVQLDIQVPITDDFELRAGVPVYLYVGTMRLRTGAQLTLDVPTSKSNPGLGVNLPFAVDVSWHKNVPISLSTGIHIRDFDDVTWEVPLGVEAGWTLGDEHPVVDLLGVFAFPRLFSPDGVSLGRWMLGARARIYIL
jgi:hypothetical protein